jgi:hypothetical protein
LTYQNIGTKEIGQVAARADFTVNEQIKIIDKFQRYITVPIMHYANLHFQTGSIILLALNTKIQIYSFVHAADHFFFLPFWLTVAVILGILCCTNIIHPMCIVAGILQM